MTEPPLYPPPGSPPPPAPGPQPSYPAYPGPAYPAPSYAAPPPASPWAGVPGAPVAAHKPGAVPLRPLGLSDIYDAAFRVLRYNPRATVGGAALVAVVSALLPVVVALVAVLAAGVTLDLSGGGSAGGGDGSASGLIVLGVTVVSGAGLLSVGLVLVTGMVAGVTHAAAVGRRVGLEEAWAGTRGRRWRLIGLSLLIGLGDLLVVALAVVIVVLVALAAGTLAAVLVGLLVGALTLVALVFLYTRLVPLAAPAMVIEQLGVVGSLRRAWTLSRGGFWRLLGITLLTTLLVAVVGGILGTPFNLVGQVGAVASERYGLLVLVVSQSLGSVLRSAFTTPFSASVNTLLYLDRRIRTEAYEIELMQQAGLLGR